MLLHFLGPDLNPIDSRALCFHLIRRYSVMFPSYIVGERSGHINLEVQREICCRKLQQVTGMLLQATDTFLQASGVAQALCCATIKRKLAQSSWRHTRKSMGNSVHLAKFC